MASPLTRTSSAVVSTRAENDTIAAFESFCAERGLTRGAALRQLMARATDIDLAGATDTDVLHAALQALKNKDPDAALEILLALKEQQAAGNSTDGATGETPDPLPPEVQKLSAADLAYCEKNSVDPQDFAKRKAAAVRRVGRVRRV